MSAAELAALSVLESFAGGRPLQPPVDPVVIARGLGINVWSTQLANNVSGELVKLADDPNADVNMYLNSEHAPVRQRFTCAHELGHYYRVLRAHPGLGLKFLFRRDDLSSCGTDLDEVFANQFAAALLMPEDVVRAAYSATPDAVELAAQFDVSVQAMGNRLVNLGLIR
jgi:Zn-dependent peptidase ImmA (M78 family)